MTRKGWHKQSARHSLAARGLKTKVSGRKVPCKAKKSGAERCPKCGLIQSSEYGIRLRKIYDTPIDRCPCGASLTGFPPVYIGPEERRYLSLDDGSSRPEEHGQEWEGWDDDGPEESPPKSVTGSEVRRIVSDARFDVNPYARTYIDALGDSEAMYGEHGVEVQAAYIATNLKAKTPEQKEAKKLLQRIADGKYKGKSVTR